MLRKNSVVYWLSCSKSGKGLFISFAKSTNALPSLKAKHPAIRGPWVQNKCLSTQNLKQNISLLEAFGTLVSTLFLTLNKNR